MMNKDYISIASLYDSGVYLAHHGIKGQKWGIRRYQNPDGSLTTAGQKRYNKISSKMNKIADQYTASNAFLIYLQNQYPSQKYAVDNAKNRLEKAKAKEELRFTDDLFKNIYSTQISRLKKYKKLEEYVKDFADVPMTSLERYPTRKTLLSDSPYIVK